jgi:hypothetical protein
MTLDAMIVCSQEKWREFIRTGPQPGLPCGAEYNNYRRDPKLFLSNYHRHELETFHQLGWERENETKIFAQISIYGFQQTIKAYVLGCDLLEPLPFAIPIELVKHLYSPGPSPSILPGYPNDIAHQDPVVLVTKIRSAALRIEEPEHEGSTLTGEGTPT